MRTLATIMKGLHMDVDWIADRAEKVLLEQGRGVGVEQSLACVEEWLQAVSKALHGHVVTYEQAMHERARMGDVSGYCEAWGGRRAVEVMASIIDHELGCFDNGPG